MAFPLFIFCKYIMGQGAAGNDPSLTTMIQHSEFLLLHFLNSHSH